MVRREVIPDDHEDRDPARPAGSKSYQCRNCLRMLPYEGDTPPGIVECHGARRTRVAGAEPGMAEHVLTWPEDDDEATPEMREAYYLLLHMTEGQRGLVLCWFCRACNRYVGPGDSCHCERDE